ncbi:MAG: HAD-IA family hydrolase [Anaerolineae bacterium]
MVFDVEGVIAHPDSAAMDAGLRALMPPLTAQDLGAARLGPDLYALWELYSCGLMTPEAYWAAVVAAAGGPVTSGRVRGVMAVMRRTWWGHIDRQMLELVRELRRRGAAVGLLSNSAPEHEARIPALAAAVDVAHFSHRTGRRKPHAGTFEAIADDLGLSREDCVFVDDKARNAKAATEVGMTAVVFAGRGPLIAELARLGLPLELDAPAAGESASPGGDRR